MLMRYKTAVTTPCPRCGAVADRIPRRGIDRFLGAFLSVRRYRCRNFDCLWEGNLRHRHTAPPDSDAVD